VGRVYRGLLDVLGQKCQFDRIKTSPLNDIPQEALDEVASKTVGAVEFVRNKLEELFLWSRTTVDPPEPGWHQKIRGHIECDGLHVPIEDENNVIDGIYNLSAKLSFYLCAKPIWRQGRHPKRFPTFFGGWVGCPPPVHPTRNVITNG